MLQRPLLGHMRRPATGYAVRRLLSTKLVGSGGDVHDLNTFDEYQNFSRDKSIMYFTAKWCPPCRQIAPEYVELSKEHQDVQFAKVDIDINAEAAEEAGIMSVPTFIFYKDGKEIGNFSGAHSNQLLDYIQELKQD
ncbi:unnamed protein product [Chrysoparadoxa australica]